MNLQSTDTKKVQSKRILCRPMDWADIRSFLIKRKPWIANAIGITDDDMHKICERDTIGLPNTLMRECSVWIDGYLYAKN
jgi:hypothetical protein